MTGWHEVWKFEGENDYQLTQKNDQDFIKNVKKVRKNLFFDLSGMLFVILTEYLL